LVNRRKEDAQVRGAKQGVEEPEEAPGEEGEKSEEGDLLAFQGKKWDGTEYLRECLTVFANKGETDVPLSKVEKWFHKYCKKGNIEKKVSEGMTKLAGLGEITIRSAGKGRVFLRFTREGLKHRHGWLDLPWYAPVVRRVGRC
jgi:hypothetical protein